MTRYANEDDGTWGPPMPFWEAMALSSKNVAGLFDELPDNWADDAPGTVLNVGLSNRRHPYANDAITRLGQLAEETT